MEESHSRMSVEPLMWEVGNCLTIRESKFAKVFLFCFLAKSYDFFFIFRASEIHADSINSDCAYPNLVFFSPIYAGISALIILSNFTICGILGSRDRSKILSAIIASIAVYMVAVYFRVGQAKNETMHELTIKRRAIWSASIESSSRMVPKGVPIYGVNSLKLTGVNDSDFRFRERDELNAFVFWLDEFIALNSVL